jgi:hypothetical protein
VSWRVARDTAQVIAQYENIRQVDPNDATALTTPV